jgi:hypothetical protein
MAKRLQHRGGTTSQHSGFTGAVREVTVDTDKNTLVIHDGSTAGGHPLATATNFKSTGIDDNADAVAITIDSSENVGIGNTTMSSFSSAGTTRFVVGDGSGDEGMTIYSGNASSANIAFADGTSGDARHAGIISYLHGENSMRFFTNASEKIKILSDGKVGIGTSSPSEKLHVVGDAKFTGQLKMSDNQLIKMGDGEDLAIYHDTTVGNVIKSNTADMDILIQGKDGATTITALTFDMSDSGMAHFGNYIKVANTVVGSNDLNLQSSDANEKITLDMSGTQRFSVDGSEKMRLTTTGLGIGTSSPSQILDIVSSSNAPLMEIRSTTTPDGSKFGGGIILGLSQANDSGSGQPDTQAGDTLGRVIFEGQGTDFTYNGAEISTVVTVGDGSDGRVNQATALVFKTIAVGGDSSAERMRITDGGLAIGGTGSANTLDDYEEGTWTPTLSGTSGGASGVNFHSRVGFYTKIGRSVHFHCFVEMQNFSSAPSGTGIVTGLPFTSANVTASYASVSIGYTVNFTATDAPRMGYIDKNSTQIVLKTSASADARNNNNANVNAGNFSGDEGIMISGHYYV